MVFGQSEETTGRVGQIGAVFIYLIIKIKKILCSFTCDLLLSLWISDLKCGQACRKNMTKNSQVNGSLRENVSVF